MPITPVASEHEEQVALMEWAELQSGRHPQLKMLFAVPNGEKRHISVAKRLKAEGVKPGVPDVVLPVPRGCWHGLFVEMKRIRGGVISKEQDGWIIALQKEGYCAVACYGWEHAAKVIKDYLALGEYCG